MAEWKEVTQEVLDIAQEAIDSWHLDLQDASIAFIFRTEAPSSGGTYTLGQAQKIKGEHHVLGLDYDFLIWIAEDWWNRLQWWQKMALIDHELCHCSFNDKGKARMVPHDIEEFNCVIERHGFWRPSSSATVNAVQMGLHLDERKRGRISAIDPVSMNGA